MFRGGTRCSLQSNLFIESISTVIESKRKKIDSNKTHGFSESSLTVEEETPRNTTSSSFHP